MPTIRGGLPLQFILIPRHDFGEIMALRVDQAERFLEPLADILDVVRRSPAHALIGIRTGGTLAGFYVVHPDRRDRACWWLGWLAIDGRFQGMGLGRAAMTAAMARLRRTHGCRRIRLLVAPDNARALSLYERAGFEPVGIWPCTDERVMECRQDQGVPTERRIDLVLNAYSLVQAMWLRLWRRGAPPAAQLSGKFHGPPARVARALRQQPGAGLASITNRSKQAP